MPSSHTEQLLSSVNRKLELARIRDEIQATRPAGCWCLGLGGRGEAALPGIAGADPFQTWSEFCSCPDGIRARAKAISYSSAYRKWRLAYLHHGVLDLASLGNYDGYTLTTYQEAVASAIGYMPAANAKIVADIKSWCSQLKRWMYIYGEPGVGKTGLLVSAMAQRLEFWDERQVLVATPDLMRSIQNTFGRTDGPRTEEVLARYYEADVLFIDDVGKENPTPWVVSEFWSLVNFRYRAGKLTAFSSNDTPKEVGASHSESLVDRITDRSMVIKVEGPRLRGLD